MIPCGILAAPGVTRALFCGSHMSQVWFCTCYRCGANSRDRPLRATLAHLLQWCPFLPVGLTC